MQKSSNNLDEKELEMIRSLAAIFMAPREIATILQVDLNEFIDQCQDAGNPIYDAFHGAWLKSQVELRTAIVKLAKAGSSPAQAMADKMMLTSKAKMFDR